MQQSVFIILYIKSYFSNFFKKIQDAEKTKKLTWFIMVESLDPSWIFFSKMFSNFTSLSDEIYYKNISDFETQLQINESPFI